MTVTDWYLSTLVYHHPHSRNWNTSLALWSTMTPLEICLLAIQMRKLSSNSHKFSEIRSLDWSMSSLPPQTLGSRSFPILMQLCSFTRLILVESIMLGLVGIYCLRVPSPPREVLLYMSPLCSLDTTYSSPLPPPLATLLLSPTSPTTTPVPSTQPTPML